MAEAPEEAVGVAFDPGALDRARARTIAAVAEIADRLVVGMAETEAVKIAASVLAAAGAEKGWHKVLVRFGPNTTKAFKDLSEPGVVLRPNDLFFVDVGPVFEGHEADFGRTFVIGDDEEHKRCARDAEAIFAEVRAHWHASQAEEAHSAAESAAGQRIASSEGAARVPLDERVTGSASPESRVTGQALYAFAETCARARGWELNFGQGQGHRIGDFPHAYHHRGKLAHFAGAPSPDRWILEIALRHPTQPFGAFFEDLLR